MGIFRLRKQPLAMRKFHETLDCANKACQGKLQKLINKGVRCSCPLCKSNGFVTKNGSKNGIPKFKCTNHKKTVHFLTTTSYEALEHYQAIMVEYLTQNACFSAQINRGVLYNEMSQYFTEFALEAFYDHIKEQSSKSKREKPASSQFITIFFDISGSALLKNKSIIMAKVNNEIIFDIEVASNYLSTHKFLATIKKKWNLLDNQRLMIISDGERCFVDSVREFFPNCIHVRQFHSESSKGIVYVHLPYEGTVHTVRFLWDAVLDEGQPSKQVQKMREYRAKVNLNSLEKKKRYSELSKDVIVWKGTVYQPRGYRRRIDGKKKICPKQKARESPSFSTTGCDTPEVLFFGSMEKAKELDIVKHCLSYLKREFGGRYITSNKIETMFNVKSKLRNHRTMKFGNRMLMCILYSEFVLKNKTKSELQEYFKENVIRYEFLQQKVLYTTGNQKREQKDKIMEILEKIHIATKEGWRMVLHYRDRLKRHSSRMILPQRIEKNEFTGLYLLHAYCEKRRENRTFLLQRIKDIEIFDPHPCIIPSPPYG